MFVFLVAAAQLKMTHALYMKSKNFQGNGMCSFSKKSLHVSRVGEISVDTLNFISCSFESWSEVVSFSV